MDLRKQYKDLFEKKHGVKLGFMGFFTKAVTHALKEIPAVNAEIDGTDIIYKNFCHIGVAVGTDKGLVVPVVRDADQMSHCRDREGNRPSRPWLRATASSAWPTCRAAPSPSPMAVSTAR
jgi:pyruvate/2-oxoglutarate dehydrogenase complex dihydrolipoamide acyltransferase (E2) component